MSRAVSTKKLPDGTFQLVILGVPPVLAASPDPSLLLQLESAIREARSPEYRKGFQDGYSQGRSDVWNGDA